MTIIFPYFYWFCPGRVSRPVYYFIYHYYHVFFIKTGHDCLLLHTTCNIHCDSTDILLSQYQKLLGYCTIDCCMTKDDPLCLTERPITSNIKSQHASRGQQTELHQPLISHSFGSSLRPASLARRYTHSFCSSCSMLYLSRLNILSDSRHSNWHSQLSVASSMVTTSPTNFWLNGRRKKKKSIIEWDLYIKTT